MIFALLGINVKITMMRNESNYLDGLFSTQDN